MNIRRRARGSAAVVAMLSIVALAASGCARGGAGAASPGITDTAITLGITTPLSGPTAGPGTCTVAGVTAYFGAVNAAGGVKFGDGKTRTVQIKSYDDAYDPQKSLANFQQMGSDGVFAVTAGLGTPTNRAFRDAAVDEKVPQVLVMTGDPLFSKRQDSPWQLGFVPIYQNEGAAFGKLLASSGGQHKVAILAQNDDYGKGYVEGFKQAIAGAANITVVRELSYEATDTSVDAQLTELSATGADVFFNAMSITPLAISALQKTQQVGWRPSWFLPSNTSSPSAILEPGRAAAFPGIYSVAFAKAPQSPVFAKDADVVKFLSDLKQYANYQDVPAFPHCMWSYMVGATLQQAFEKMTAPTRDAFMTALRGISNFHAPLMLEGTAVDTTKDGQPAVSSVVVQKYNGKGYATVQNFG
ncbi:ABC transporter substrate-binding protein [Amycolatopsis acidiphila]|uniref:ABC transporter substrate-binding protein n=1 Tax=Amycolatopsis acidiphila TaxID=715473 RepID=A0A558A8N0_9PSEU|nr:ABC transporter substrate-binding protein [Amycolatopsis acidiphila]TVT20613.1 ABC transporter substrate-binding protein [Amycolatopsis acidiphila]UIJ61391.1 ABC transporter substrate-binding protein [Amycolatopsis acidiphila]GHG77887.1 branched-chain amino acid ABC transporter substrate-binding protein [Amycolatopsis acidiphila]